MGLDARWCIIYCTQMTSQETVRLAQSEAVAGLCPITEFALATSFETVGANEWLLTQAPYTHGEISFAATSATVDEAIVLRCPERSALFMMERVTLDGDVTVTTVRILFGPGHRLCTVL